MLINCGLSSINPGLNKTDVLNQGFLLLHLSLVLQDFGIHLALFIQILVDRSLYLGQHLIV